MNLKAGLLCSVVGLALGLHERAFAQEKSFNLQPAVAAFAIPEFARQAGVQIVAPATGMEGVLLPSLNGTYDIKEALALLLVNTDLEVLSFEGDVVILRRVVRKEPTAPPRKFTKKAGDSKAPTQSVPQAVSDGPFQEIIVTGSRIVRDGYRSPTPVTVISAESLQTGVTTNISDAISQLPTLANSSSPQSAAINLSTGQGGVNGLNLRGLGATRTLVLLNGQRIVGSTLAGVVDVGALPQGLVQRVDIVTGGASAAYGSDALTGVVNFVLDTEFTGLRGEVSGGGTTYRDNLNYKVDATYGSAFGGDRGHFLLSGEHAAYAGLLTWEREWAKAGWDFINNPAYAPGNGQPSIILSDRVSIALATAGGLITSGPLKGTAFGAGGAVSKIVYGDIVAGTVMRGGSWAAMDPTFTQGVAAVPEGNRQSAFSRLSYDVSDSIEVYGQAGWGHQYNFSQGGPHYYLGNLSIRTDNAYIPEALRPALQAAGPTFLMGTLLGDLGPWRPSFDRRTLRTNAGAKGDCDAFETMWSWDSYISYGQSWGASKGINYHSFPRFAEAVDAARAPTGTIVCRSTLTNPNNGCVPYNVFGTGVNSPEAIRYETGIGGPYTHQKIAQTVGAINFYGDPLSTWAGPVSLAFGYEFRREMARQESDPEEVANPAYWTFAAGLPFSGEVTVNDIYTEAAVPLAKDTAWARTFDLNAAARATHYSVYGWVSTYKLGATYTPVDDVRLRVTQSRNIRSPTLIDLFQAGTTSSVSVRDPFNNNLDTPSTQTTTGNRNLGPEKSNDLNLGLVYQPSWLAGFNASIDYYQIKVNGAINNPGGQALIDLCALGNQQACTGVSRAGSGATMNIFVAVKPLNLASEKAQGVDIEASYRKALSAFIDGAAGEIQIRALATHYIKYDTLSGLPGDHIVHLAGAVGGNQFNGNGGAGVPAWRITGALAYADDPLTTGLTLRWIQGGRNNPRWIECNSGCPNPSGSDLTVDNNHVASALFMDFNFSYKFHLGHDETEEFFFNVQNVMDSDPPIVGAGPGGTSWWSPTVPQGANFDTLGRTLRAGVRFGL